MIRTCSAEAVELGDGVDAAPGSTAFSPAPIVIPPSAMVSGPGPAGREEFTSTSVTMVAAAISTTPSPTWSPMRTPRWRRFCWVRVR
ncbi:hypothetical protein [Curtobacterium sp. MCJR17_043]|uniref:hypothetical protein n=1 Tax=Curtobacterium sp. MCJR17_043 TaxID=2175660 RepID=UPI0024DF9112|nr:hypothetical protein [Curtobacterium sp. MCJR17_043]WIB35773.1 hypothetical protein DEJ15_17015 [Curtobacterium sp. MCJR17_043]